MGLDKEHAERIALEALKDEGVAAFPDFERKYRDVEVGDDENILIERLRAQLDAEWDDIATDDEKEEKK